MKLQAHTHRIDFNISIRKTLVTPSMVYGINKGGMNCSVLIQNLEYADKQSQLLLSLVVDENKRQIGNIKLLVRMNEIIFKY